jgi:hypothetical protein
MKTLLDSSRVWKIMKNNSLVTVYTMSIIENKKKERERRKEWKITIYYPASTLTIDSMVNFEKINSLTHFPISVILFCDVNGT